MRSLVLQLSVTIGPVLLAGMGITVALIPNVARRRPEKFYIVLGFLVIGTPTFYASWRELRLADRAQHDLTVKQDQIVKAQEKIIDLRGELISYSSGGDSFSYLEADTEAPLSARTTASLLITTHGHYPVLAVRYWISELAANGDRNDQRYWSVGIGGRQDYLLAGSNLIGNQIVPGEYRVEIDAKNGTVIEDLKISICNGRVDQSITVKRNGKTLIDRPFQRDCS